jgi:3-oxoacyl-[acyl-carrier-protein] synthase-3
VGWNLTEVDKILLHQGSKFMVEQLGKLLRADPEQVPLRLAGVGNTVSSSIPLLLADEIDNPRVKRMILSGFGVGLSWASAALSRNPEE